MGGKFAFLIVVVGAKHSGTSTNAASRAVKTIRSLQFDRMEKLLRAWNATPKAFCVNASRSKHQFVHVPCISSRTRGNWACKGVVQAVGKAVDRRSLLRCPFWSLTKSSIENCFPTEI